MKAITDPHGFYTGQHFDTYEYLGAHPGEEGTTFRTFAPAAANVSLLLNGQEIPMNRVFNGQFFEVTAPEAKPGDLYEYRIYLRDGSYTDHADPYGFQMELRPAHKSVITDLSTYTFHDEDWMAKRANENTLTEPINIYEMHTGSWRKPEGGWYRYDELADMLIPYLKENGYNAVEFLPLSEHPSDESWGYQNTGFFAPTSRYGTPDQLRYLIDKLHQNGIRAILDYVPVHFAIDDYGLARYDGTELYEYPNSAVGVSEWGSYNFMHSRGEVRSFLQSAANYWLKEFHFDGLRMDAISRIIYWQGDERRGVNGNALDFIKVMNPGLKERNSGVILIAEDSTSLPGTTKPVSEGGLGFDYKWDMGWMHDTLDFFQTPPDKRPEAYHKLTFSMMYFPNEHYLLPYSHDEVVHGKGTILNKMAGEYEEKFPQARAMYMYMMVHPGKKLNFMGNELGQLREWDEKREQDWNLLEYPIHDAFHRYIRDLNRVGLHHPALYEWDYEDKGFKWLDCHQEDKCVYAIERASEDEKLVSVFNFSNKPVEKYELELPDTASVKALINTDWKMYGGTEPDNKEDFTFEDGKLTVDLPPYSGLLLETEPKPEEEKKEEEKPASEES